MSVSRQLGPFEGGTGGLDHGADGPAEHLFALHDHVGAVIGVQDGLQGAVDAQVPTEQASVARDGLENDGARPVAEEDRGVSVLPVGDPGEALGPDEQDPVDARPDEGRRRHEAVDESRTGGVEVEGPTAQAESIRDRRRRGRHRLVRCRGAQDEQIDLMRLEPGAFEGLTPGFGGEEGRGADPARRRDPLGERRRRGAKGPHITRRSRIPVRARIHSSLVSTSALRSSLVTTVGGRAVPQPMMALPRPASITRPVARRRAGRSGRAHPETPASPSVDP